MAFALDYSRIRFSGILKKFFKETDNPILIVNLYAGKSS
jgi:hypothetical protein